ncbi:MAG: alpha-1,4-glucan--maltose-1-phosphate maltosyltransferase [Thermoplasmata archaeon]
MSPRRAPPRAVVENLEPQVDDGRTPARRSAGESVDVSADVFAEGTNQVRAEVKWRRAGESAWQSAPMVPGDNDRWRGRFSVPAAGVYQYTVEAWVDPFAAWYREFERRAQGGTVAPIDFREGAKILERIARRAAGADRDLLRDHTKRLREAADGDPAGSVRLGLEEDPVRIAGEHPEPSEVTRYPQTLTIEVDPRHAQHSAWYEIFPRSTSPRPGPPGTFRDLRVRLHYIADLGFDVVYLPPIHPIGRTNRRGPNNSPNPPPDAPGSPWAIGSELGGHTSVAPELGTLEEFDEIIVEARRLGLEVALDLAFQCSPDHPWVREHPDWFHQLPDGTIRTAENPPKKYDDIYPFDFATRDREALWVALKGVVDFWVAHGVRWFRVDNPHTKPFEFWRWLIAEVRGTHPEVLFLAEAFTRPKVMYELAKVGFTHSYTYFAWRTTRAELTAYFDELSRAPVHEIFRPHLWPNTPDILTPQLHSGRRSVFVQRLVLAATLSSHYGIYGPPYELLEHTPLEVGKEEYLDSEKYAVRFWRLDAPQSLAPEIRRINQIRRENAALREGQQLTFHSIDNDHLLSFSRRADDGNVVLVVVNLNPEGAEIGWTALNLPALGLGPDASFEVVDLWNGPTYQWHGPRNFVRLDPALTVAHVFRVRLKDTSTHRGGALD